MVWLVYVIQLLMSSLIIPFKPGYCKKLGPEFDAAASNLKGLVNLVAVDCDEAQNKQFCQEQGVKGQSNRSFVLTFNSHSCNQVSLP